MKSRILFLWLWLVYAEAIVWEFGSDVRGTSVISQKSGDISFFEKDVSISLPIPTCMEVKYVHVEVHNLVTSPSVTYNKHTHVVVISYKMFQSSISSYNIMAKGKRSPLCSGRGQRPHRPPAYNSQNPPRWNNNHDGGNGNWYYPGGNGNWNPPGGNNKYYHPGGYGQYENNHEGNYPNQNGGNGRWNRPGGNGQRPRPGGNGQRPKPHRGNENWNRPGRNSQYPNHPGGNSNNDNRPRNNGNYPPHLEGDGLQHPGGNGQMQRYPGGNSQRPDHPQIPQNPRVDEEDPILNSPAENYPDPSVDEEMEPDQEPNHDYEENQPHPHAQYPDGPIDYPIDPVQPPISPPISPPVQPAGKAKRPRRPGPSDDHINRPY